MISHICISLRLRLAMLVSALFILFVSAPISVWSQEEECSCLSVEEPMKAMFDLMEDMYEEGATFSDGYYQVIRECLNLFDPELPSSQDGAWKGMIEYWCSNGTAEDPWGQNHPNNVSECNPTETSMCGMVIYEPCGFPSNVAFYHTITEVCQRVNNDTDWPFHMSMEYVKAIVQSFAMVGAMSSFWHGSHTEVGGQQDFISNDVFAFVHHQASLSSIPYNSILHDLCDEPRDMNSTEIAQFFTDMYRNESVYDWYELTDALDVPSIELCYGALVSTIFSMIFEPNVTYQLIENLGAIFGLTEDELSFVLDEYLPTLIAAIDGFQWTDADRVKFIGNTVGTLTKLIYACIWNEGLFDIPDNIIESYLINGIGWNLLPDINVRAGQVMTYRYYEQKFQLANNTYPGEEVCNPRIPHAKWHLEAGIGMVDLNYLVDDIDRYLSTVPDTR